MADDDPPISRPVLHAGRKLAVCLDALEAVGTCLGNCRAGKGGWIPRSRPTGYPLSTIELLQLKLASAILAKPRVLVLTRLFDLIEADYLARALDALARTGFYHGGLFLQPRSAAGL